MRLSSSRDAKKLASNLSLWEIRPICACKRLSTCSHSHVHAASCWADQPLGIKERRDANITALKSSARCEVDVGNFQDDSTNRSGHSCSQNGGWCEYANKNMCMYLDYLAICLSLCLSVCRPGRNYPKKWWMYMDVPTIPKRVQNHQLSSQESERFGFLCTLAIFKVRMSHSSCSRKVFPAFSTMISKQSKTSYIQGWSRSITAALKQNMSKNVLGTSCSWFKIPVDKSSIWAVGGSSAVTGVFTEISGVVLPPNSHRGCPIPTGRPREMSLSFCCRCFSIRASCASSSARASCGGTSWGCPRCCWWSSMPCYWDTNGDLMDVINLIWQFEINICIYSIYSYGSKAMEPHGESQNSWDLWTFMPPDVAI